MTDNLPYLTCYFSSACCWQYGVSRCTHPSSSNVANGIGDECEQCHILIPKLVDSFTILEVEEIDDIRQRVNQILPAGLVLSTRGSEWFSDITEAALTRREINKVTDAIVCMILPN